jgi:hypothetical protein
VCIGDVFRVPGGRAACARGHAPAARVHEGRDACAGGTWRQEECEDEAGDALHGHVLAELLFAQHMGGGAQGGADGCCSQGEGGCAWGWRSRLDADDALDALELRVPRAI